MIKALILMFLAVSPVSAIEISAASGGEVTASTLNVDSITANTANNVTVTSPIYLKTSLQGPITVQVGSVTFVNGGLSLGADPSTITAAGSLILSTSATSIGLYISTTNAVFIGTGTAALSSISGALATNTQIGLGIVGQGSGTNRLYLFSENAAAFQSLHNAGTGNPALHFSKSTGTLNFPQGIGTSQVIGTIRWNGMRATNTSFAANASIIAQTAAEGIGSASQPTDLLIAVAPSGSVTTTTRVILTSTGVVGIGYTSAATVSQTDKLDVNGGSKLAGQVTVSGSSITVTAGLGGHPSAGGLGITGAITVTSGSMTVVANGADAILTTGHITSTGTAPTLGTCGTGGTIDGTDTAGTITVGTTPGISCTITFATAYGSDPPSCFCNNQTTANLTRAGSTTASATSCDGAMIASDKINYLCIGAR